MRSRFLIVVAVLLLASSFPAFGATAADPSTYPGSGLQFEMTFTDKDFLPALKQFLPMIPGMIGEGLQQGPQKPGVQPAASTDLSNEQLAKDLMDALSGLKKVSVSGYSLKSSDPGKVLQFYAQKIGLSSGWNQPLKFNDPNASFRLYVKPDLAEMFGLFVAPTQFVVIRTEGRIDVAKLAGMAGKFVPMFIVRGATNVQQAPQDTAPAETSAQPFETRATEGPSQPGAN